MVRYYSGFYSDEMESWLGKLVTRYILQPRRESNRRFQLKPTDFAFQLAAWMSPGVLARAAADWGNPPEGHEITNLRFESPILARSSDAQFEWFVRQFLDHVIIPEELIRYTRGMYERHLSREAVEWLRTFKFTGSVEFNPPNYAPQIQGAHVLIAISAPLYEIRVIWSPIQMLNELISIKANYWRRLATRFRPAQLHYQVRGEWPFEPWVDLRVARSCGFPDIGHAASIPRNALVNNVRGRVSVAGGHLPRSAEELALVASIAPGLRKERSADYGLYQWLKSGQQ
jgi:hypothetical protein